MVCGCVSVYGIGLVAWVGWVLPGGGVGMLCVQGRVYMGISQVGMVVINGV